MVNQAMCAITGYSEQELCARTSAEITHPDDVAADVTSMGRLRSGGARSHELDKRYLTPTGRVVWASTSV